MSSDNKFPITTELTKLEEKCNDLARDLKKAEESIKAWKDAWFHQRDIIGNLTYEASFLHSINTLEDVVRFTQKYSEAKQLIINNAIKEFHTYHPPEQGKCFTCRPETG